MSIPVSNIVSVNPRLIAPGRAGLELNGLFLTVNEALSNIHPLVEFTDVASCGEFFGFDSDEYKLAQVYFAGFESGFKKPSRIYFGKYITGARASIIYGGKISIPVSALNGMSGDITLETGTTLITCPVNLTAVKSFQAAALVIEKAFEAAFKSEGKDFTLKLSYNTAQGKFTAELSGKNPDKDTNNTYSFSGDMASKLGLEKTCGALFSPSVPGITVAENMELIRSLSDNFATFSTVFSAGSGLATELQRWAAGFGVRYLYVYWSGDTRLLENKIPNGFENPVFDFAENNAAAVTAVYGNALHAAFVSGMVASIDYQRPMGVITTAFKKQPGLKVNVDNQQHAQTLIKRNINFYGEYAGNNAEFKFFYPGCMFGSYRWIDMYVNAIWLNSCIQKAQLDLLSGCGRLPYTEEGYSLVAASVQGVLNQAVNAGVIDKGVSLSDEQKNRLMLETGRGAAEALSCDGYYLQIKDPGAVLRGERQTPVVSLWYTYAGAVQRLELSSTAVQ